MTDAPVVEGAGRRLPPIVQMGVVCLGLVVIGGIYLAANLPRPPALAPAVGVLASAGLILVASMAMLSRVQEFAWAKFFLVGRWALAAYVVVAGMLEYIFVLDHTRGAVLAVLTLMLVVYAVDIPMLLAFSVARYHPAGPEAEDQGLPHGR
ncbi:MAG: hypothetical protein ACRDZQ_07450 [Acidimicrobiales bacterium]